MDGAVCNLLSPGDTAIFVNGGKFGERWGDILRAYGVQAVEVARVPGGQAVSRGRRARGACGASAGSRGVHAGLRNLDGRHASGGRGGGAVPRRRPIRSAWSTASRRWGWPTWRSSATISMSSSVARKRLSCCRRAWRSSRSATRRGRRKSRQQAAQVLPRLRPRTRRDPAESKRLDQPRLVDGGPRRGPGVDATRGTAGALRAARPHGPGYAAPAVQALGMHVMFAQAARGRRHGGGAAGGI